MRKQVLFLFTFLCCLSGTAQFPSSYPDQVLFLRSYFDQPATLLRFKEQAEKNGNFLFVNAIRLVENSYNSASYPATQNEAEKELLELIDESGSLKRKEQAAHAMYLLSQHYWLKNMPDKALEYGLKAYDLYAPMDGKDFPPKMVALYELASKFYYYHDFTTARRYFIEAASSTDSFKMMGRVTLLNTIGLCYRNLQQYDSAEYYFKNAFRLIDNTADIWNGILKGNLGITYYYQKQFAAAIPLLKEDIEQSFNGAPDNAANSLAILGDIYLQQGERREAALALQQANSLLETKCKGDARLVMAIYPRLAKLYEHEGNYRVANQLLNTAVATKDSLSAKTNALILSGVQLKVDAEKHSVERKVLEQQRDMQGYVRNTLIAGILLLAAFGILFINRQKLKHQYKVKQTREELEEATRQLELFTLALHQKNEMLDQYNQQLEEIRQEQFSNHNASADIETITQLQQLTLVTDVEWENFRTLFEKVHAGFLFRLRQKMPGLSAADIRFLALTKLNLSNKEIANALGVGPGAVRTAKSRLRKKLNLAEEASIEDFIERI